MLVPFKKVEITASGYARLTQEGLFLGDIQLSEERMSILGSQFNNVGYCNLQYSYTNDTYEPGADEVDEREIYWCTTCSKVVSIYGDYRADSVPEGLSLLITNLRRIMLDIEQKSDAPVSP